MVTTCDKPKIDQSPISFLSAR